MKIRNKLVSSSILYIPIGAEAVMKEYLKEQKKYNSARKLLSDDFITPDDFQRLVFNINLLDKKLTEADFGFYVSSYWEIIED
jgi:hypothetical protein